MRKIDADKLVQSIDHQFELLQIFRNGDKTLKEIGGETLKQFGDILHACLMQEIANAPTVDAVEVVRCKDCKWYESAFLKRDGTTDKRYKPNVCVRGRYAKPRKADWYCANGERREDG